MRSCISFLPIGFHGVDRDIPLIRDKGVTTQNVAFFSYWYRKKRLQMKLLTGIMRNAVCKTNRWRAVVSSLHS